MQFDHERLDVYKRAIEYLVFANDVIEKLPRGRGYLADEMQRAALSIVLNIAEGAGEFAQQEKARFYRMARRSATESAAVLDACLNLKLVESAVSAAGRDLLVQIVSMLVRMISNLGPQSTPGEEEEGKGKGKGKGKETQDFR